MGDGRVMICPAPCFGADVNLACGRCRHVMPRLASRTSASPGVAANTWDAFLTLICRAQAICCSVRVGSASPPVCSRTWNLLPGAGTRPSFSWRVRVP